MIDLRKASLLKTFSSLPYEIVIPDVLFEHEFVKFTKTDQDDLIENGVQIADLSGAEISRVSQLQTQQSSLPQNTKRSNIWLFLTKSKKCFSFIKK
ncbi:hypothetical protein GF373_07990 [bacterium]|nr:hypothetical protein [bacterium]